MSGKTASLGYRFDGRGKFKLSKIDPDSTPGLDRERAEAKMEADCRRIAELQERLYAENRRSLLIVLQAMDTAGKDGTIRKVFRCVNPMGCEAVAFKVPSEEERDHDFLWRIYRALPRKGNLGIFNRSHYEDVLVARVRRLAPKKEWRARYDYIRTFEKLVSDLGTRILKVFLHISKDEQKKRLEDRLADPKKHWKFDPGDLRERARWDDYMEAYEDAIRETSAPHAPWIVVPSNAKWYRNAVVADVIARTLEEMDPQPPPSPDLSSVRVR